ncbi:two-component system sensor histidine kinase MprB [Kitasatospora sp. MAP12-15]|uniref:HAMP domain-containing sensor histidine kinase n=1 Tax=unclassified Kitasatospora TaxID=2633591 RepID=UPI00247662C7|nr:HAMP domain-containing sensor histidine kinase [Kitasatospora sp. MAP12-44]MDH6109486.1 two-component system sensor histidine kinase MprB [Kitasatospora sp. MAP12-44]
MRAHARWRRRRPLRTRLALAGSAAVALVALGVCAAAFTIVRYELRHQLDLHLVQQVSLLQQQDRNRVPGVSYGECGYLAAPACTQIVPAAASADPAAPYLLPVTTATRQVAARQHGAYYTNIQVSGHPARMYTAPFGDGQAVQVALRSDSVEQGVRQAGELMAAVAGAGVLLAGALGYVVARTGLAPVARLTATAERIAATRDAGLRIELPPGPPAGRREDEVTRLASSFNTMLGELEQSVAAQRRLVADASHELRTPLTALRTNAELLARAERLTPAQRERASAGLHRQLREVTGLVNDLIELARDEEPQPLLEQVRPAALVEHCVSAARDHWPTVAFDLLVSPDAVDLTLPGVPARLARLLSNLLDNAAKFSPPGGPVEVTLTGSPFEALELTVRDHGPGIAPEDLPYVFDRFYRASAARALPGSGLGLAMARQIAQAHSATLTAEQAPDGGALFRLHFDDHGLGAAR